MKITFFGAVHEVTGSKYLIEHEGIKVLVDCGLFQGGELARHNWDKFSVDPSTIDAVVLTHAHIDHTGYIPMLVKSGFKNKIYCSEGTFALSSILLVDSGMLQEEDAAHANKHGYSRHQPALPLYTKQDAQESLKYFQVVPFDTTFTVGNALHITLLPSGHILGSSFITISDGKQTITFSGDLGRPNDFIMKAPTHLKHTDILVIESTYGDRLHETADPLQAIAEVVNNTVAKGGKLVIPSFAVGRAQTLLYCLYQLKHSKQIPDVPIFLDSPMAISVTNLLCQFKDETNLSPHLCTDICDVATYTQTRDDSMAINDVNGPAIIISASGMATGGRVMHHLEHLISDAKNTVLFVGFQAQRTIGRALIDGAKEIKIHGMAYQVNAEIASLGMFSAHADYNEILEWIGYFETSPKKIFITHGELEPAHALKQKIEERFKSSVVVPKYLDSFDLD